MSPMTNEPNPRREPDDDDSDARLAAEHKMRRIEQQMEIMRKILARDAEPSERLADE
jgi:hypothetical protein